MVQLSYRSGSVGIGVTTPTELLHIKNPSNSWNQYAKIRIGTETSDSYASEIGFHRGTSNDTDRGFFIDGGGAGTQHFKVLHTGNVGIGTGNPAHKLDIYGTDDITMRIHRPSSGLGLNDTCGIGFSQRGDTNTSTSDTRAGIFSTYNGSLHLCTEPGGNLNSNPVDHAALSIVGTDQNVGIGTDAPSRKLDVRGAVRFSVNTTTHETFVFTTQAVNDAKQIMKNASSADTIVLNTGGDSWLNGGDVGIGTNSPVSKLHVYNSGGGDATDKATMLSQSVMKLQPHASNSTNMLFAQVANGSAMGIQVTNGPATANWDISLSPFGGKVGIGLGSALPTTPLQVAGEILATNVSFTNGSGSTSVLGATNSMADLNCGTKGFQVRGDGGFIAKNMNNNPFISAYTSQVNLYVSAQAKLQLTATESEIHQSCSILLAITHNDLGSSTSLRLERRIH